MSNFSFLQPADLDAMSSSTCPTCETIVRLELPQSRWTAAALSDSGFLTYSEVEEIKTIASVARSSLEQVEAQLLLTQTYVEQLLVRVDELVSRRSALKHSLVTHSALIAPIRRLSVKVLSRIFEWCINWFHPVSVHHPPIILRANSLSHSFPPLRLGMVCRIWINIAYSTPVLWSNVSIVHASCRTLKTLRGISTLLPLSKTLPLYVCYANNSQHYTNHASPSEQYPST